MCDNLDENLEKLTLDDLFEANFDPLIIKVWEDQQEEVDVD